MPGSYSAIYDFELLPYALGDVLTWNVQTAIRCEETGRGRVDVYICADARYPASIYQKHLVTASNYGLFLSELFGAFGTHPRLGNVLVYHRREDLLQRLRDSAKEEGGEAEGLSEYEQALALRTDEDAVIEFFTRRVKSHERINAFARQHGRIPLLQASRGSEPDVAGFGRARLSGRRVVAIHVRLRRVDAGYGGEQTYTRDSDFLEWYEFLKEAEKKYPDVAFVLLGRLQEKPLEFLRLPNVISLRTFGLGIGHELTLIREADLFIGTSSGFAAMANFSQVPYFVTQVTPQSCKAYGIEQGTESLPFASERQRLVYEPETHELLMHLLERGLASARPRSEPRPPMPDPDIDVRSWEGERSRWLYPNATTYRFYTATALADKETAFLLWPSLKRAQAAWGAGEADQAAAVLSRIEGSFPRVCERFREFLRLKHALATRRGDQQAMSKCSEQLSRLEEERSARGLSARLLRYRLRTYPLLEWLKWAWRRKHRIPRRLAALLSHPSRHHESK
jgi:hypothetical protein